MYNCASVVHWELVSTSFLFAYSEDNAWLHSHVFTLVTVQLGELMIIVGDILNAYDTAEWRATLDSIFSGSLPWQKKQLWFSCILGLCTQREWLLLRFICASSRSHRSVPLVRKQHAPLPLGVRSYRNTVCFLLPLTIVCGSNITFVITNSSCRIVQLGKRHDRDISCRFNNMIYRTVSFVADIAI